MVETGINGGLRMSLMASGKETGLIRGNVIRKEMPTRYHYEKIPTDHVCENNILRYLPEVLVQ